MPSPVRSQEFGFRQPIVVDKDGVIIVGHTRWKAAQKLGLKQVPVHVATDLTPSADQGVPHRRQQDAPSWPTGTTTCCRSSWLEPRRRWTSTSSLLGFDAGRADRAARAATLNEGLCDPDEIPEPPDEAITKPGDL